MLFQSQFYILIFLPVSLLAYYRAAASVAARQWVLLLASLFFYGWWDVRFIPLLVGQVSATWALARLHDRMGMRWPLWAGVVLNLASLATFKYLNFLLGTLEAVAHLKLPRADIVLPLGISFFSFQLISYLVDRMRGDAPIYPLRTFAVFVMFFPHLIAGPIVRHNELIPQLAANPLRGDLPRALVTGLVIFTLGLAKKLLLADPLAAIVDPLFAQGETAALGFGAAWTAALGFSFQLFLDFSAYTEMAIGSALMFNLVLPENFRRPYLAGDLRAFWRRWHITLSNFVRDYLYIPLGGSRAGEPRFVVAILGAFAVCGLWHGAGWTYVAWGLWHGCGLVICHFWQKLRRPLPVWAGWALTMLFVQFGWVLFRAPNFAAAGATLSAMLGFASGGVPAPVLGAGGLALFAAAALASCVLPSAHEIRDGSLAARPLVAGGMALVAAYCLVEAGTGAPAAFIYFQF